MTVFWQQKKWNRLFIGRIVNNADWYAGVGLIDFMANMGKHFRMGNMLSRASVQTRLQSEAGMSFMEFAYQAFQAYDWLHLYKQFDCCFQLGGSDQMGNIMSGYELIGRLENKPVYGEFVLVPLETVYWLNFQV